MKKKNLFSLVALATLTLGSCTNDEVVNDYSQDNAIQFGTYMGRDVQGRATIMDDAKLQTTGFGVFASYTGSDDWNNNKPDFMYNQEVTYASNAWSYSPVKYWPTTKNDQISFFAYAPYAATDNATDAMEFSTNTATGIPTITFTIADDPSKMVDFVADVEYNKSRKNVSENDEEITDDDVTNTVTFNLQHELTRVAMFAKVDEENDIFTENDKNKTIVNITDVKLDAATAFYKKATYTFAASNDVRGIWSGHEAASDFDLTNILNKNKSQNITAYTTEGIELTGATVTPLFKAEASDNDDKTNENHYLYLIPVDRDGLDAEGDVKVTISYDIVTLDTAVDGGFTKTSAVKTVSLPQGLLKQGTAYCLTFIIAVDEIELSAEVVEWAECTKQEVEVDYIHDK